MNTFDFTQISSKYPLLKPKDISFLNDFFNRPDILTVISDAEDKRKRGLFLIIMATIFTVLIIGYVIYFFMGHEYFNKKTIHYPLYIISLIFLTYSQYYKTVIKKFRSNIKNGILSKMIDSSDFGVKYSDNSKYFADDLSNISNNTNLIKKFEKIYFMEDSIVINEEEKGYFITGMEYSTSVKKMRNTVNNHGYLMKIKFNNPTNNINSSISLLTRDNNYIKICIFLGGSVIMLYFIFILAGTIAQFVIVILVLFLFEFINYLLILIPEQINNIKKNKGNLVKLENVEFEDRFNVYSEDDSITRTILTPSFIYRIYDYVNKINKNRKYDFYFNGDYIYVNHKISSDYLEISFFKSLYLNISDYVEFYQELKNISELAFDLKLSFYDKNFGLNNVIK